MQQSDFRLPLEKALAPVQGLPLELYGNTVWAEARQ